MFTANYSARPLSISREYVGYQFYARMTLDGYSSEKCLCYAALTIQNWLCERIANAGNEVPEFFRCPPADSFADVDLMDLHGAESSIAGIVSIPEKGIWSLWVREPDTAVRGRSYITHAAVRTVNDTAVDFGVYIDIIDRDAETEEAEFAFRPQFVRLLFQTKGLRMTQKVPLLFKNYTAIGTKKDVQSFVTLAEERDNQMPLVVFTYAPEENKDIDELIELISKVTSPVQKTTAFPLPQLPHAPISTTLADPARKVPVNRQMIRKNGGTKASDPGIDISGSVYHLPYDVEEFAKHTYGFGKVFVVSEHLFDEFCRRIHNTKVKEGDILLMEPVCFGGEIHVYPFRPGLSKNAYASTVGDIQNLLMRYSKRKPYRFGTVLFDEAAQDCLKELEFEALRKEFTSSQSETERRLLAQLEEERKRSADLQQQVFGLRSQLAEEYQKGAAGEKAKTACLEEKYTEAKGQIIDLQDRISGMQTAFKEARSLREALDSVRTIRSLPQSNAEVVSYFRTVYPDRIDFTAQGERTAGRCCIRPEVLWDCLYSMVTELVEIHRSNPADVEEEYRIRTGWEAAMSEGSQTRSNPKLMALRKDTYRGREISIEPHVKFDRSEKKTGAAFQRLYYCYDAETRMILVGYVGNHLENFSSLGFN